MLIPSRTVLTALGLAEAARLERLEHLRTELAALRAEFAARREIKYSPDQPRDERGRWTFGEGSGSDQASDDADLDLNDLDNGSTNGAGFGEAPDGTPVEPAGGIPKDKLNWTAQQFVSQHCKGSIRSVMPGEMLRLPLSEVLRLAKEGNRSARTCLKLLNQDEYRK
jgi:hypothetical protein